MEKLLRVSGSLIYFFKFLSQLRCMILQTLEYENYWLSLGLSSIFAMLSIINLVSVGWVEAEFAFLGEKRQSPNSYFMISIDFKDAYEALRWFFN